MSELLRQFWHLTRYGLLYQNELDDNSVQLPL
jgi:hypothetical protein